MNARRWSALAVSALLLALFVGTQVRVYDGLNKGVTIGDCGIEIVGDPGPFCGSDGVPATCTRTGDVPTIGVHADGSSDVYCGAPALLPAGTVPLPTS